MGYIFFSKMLLVSLSICDIQHFPVFTTVALFLILLITQQLVEEITDIDYCEGHIQWWSRLWHCEQ